jgi:LuxR family transcriptional regulator, maltose regulon positive regulatory protein
LQARVSKLLVEALLATRSSSQGRVRTLLDRSLRLAAADELRRPFREAGPAIGRLLTTNADMLLHHRWLTDPTAPGAEASASHDLDASSTPPAGLASVMVETLTPKELEVLGHLEQLLTTDEIAAEMFVSVNTVRTHVRSVLRKLGVNRRNAAVRKARELGLVSA